MSAHNAGRAAAEAGLDVTACPHPVGSDDAAAWYRGWGKTTGAVPLDLVRRRIAGVQAHTEPDYGDALDGARPLDEWPEPLRSQIHARLRTPTYADPGYCRWCRRGVKIPEREREADGPRWRPYRRAADLARHEGDCWRNPDADRYVAGDRGFTCTVDGSMVGWYGGAEALAEMRRVMGGLRHSDRP